MFRIVLPTQKACAKCVRTAVLISVWSVIALVVFMASSTQGAFAQLTVRVDASDEMRVAVEERGAIPPDELYALLAEGVLYRYEGEEPLEARFLVFFMNAESVRSVVAGKPVAVEPGTGMGLGRSLSEEAFLAFYEEAAGQPFYPAIPALPPAPDLFRDAEDIVRQFGDSWSPEAEEAWARAFNGIKGANTKGGIGIALVPIIGRYVRANLSELQVGMMAMSQAER